MRYIVCYHNACTDGFTAAFCAYLFHKKNGTLNQTEFVPVNPLKTPDIDVTDASVIMFDVCLDKEALLKWSQIAYEFFVLDHHASNENDFGHIKCCKFDMNRSGAKLAWDWYNPGIEAPWWVQYVQDADLYTWKLPESRKVSAFMYSLDMDFSVYENLDKISLEEVKITGQYIRLADESKIKRIIKNPMFIKIQNYNVPCINSNVYQSELGNLLAEKYNCPFAVIWYVSVNDEGEKFAQVSFRSVNNFDVSKIAQIYKGGGHKAAAGARIPLSLWTKTLNRNWII